MNAGLVDVHAHLLTERYVEEASRAGHARPDGMPAWPRWSRDEQLRLMDSLGIERALLSVSSPGVHFGDPVAAVELARHVNDEAARIAAGSAGRLEFLASVPLPDVDAAVDEARRIAEAPGCRGVIVLSHAAGRYPGTRDLDPFWGELAGRAAVVLVHPTSPPGWDLVSQDRPRPALEFPVETARAVLSLLESSVPQRFPALRFVLPHAGGVLAAVVDRLETFRIGGLLGELPGPLPEALRGFWFDTAGAPLPTLLPALGRHVPADRVVYGSDFCFTPAAGVALHLGALDATMAPQPWGSWREALASNAETLLGPGSPRTGAARGTVRTRQRVVQRVFERVATRVLLGGTDRGST